MAAPAPALPAQTMHSFENNRWYPIRGWAGGLLPTDRPHWSSADGRVSMRKNNVALPPRYVWQGDWVVVVDAGVTTDAEGWEYAVDFPMEEWRCHSGKSTCVRRRRWERLAVQTPVAAGAVSDEQYVDAGEEPDTPLGEEAPPRPADLLGEPQEFPDNDSFEVRMNAPLGNGGAVGQPAHDAAGGGDADIEANTKSENDFNSLFAKFADGE
jgi:hypothetical protein